MFDEAGLGDPWTRADSVPQDEPDSESSLVKVVDEIVEPLEADGLELSGLAGCLLFLAAAAQDAAKGHSSRAAAVYNILISLEGLGCGEILSTFS